MIITPCGHKTNTADCSYCLTARECREIRAGICTGCIREGKCPPLFRQKRVDEGECKGKEIVIS